MTYAAFFYDVVTNHLQSAVGRRLCGPVPMPYHGAYHGPLSHPGGASALPVSHSLAFHMQLGMSKMIRNIASD